MKNQNAVELLGNLAMSRLKDFNLPLRKLSEETGINITRLFRLRSNNKEPKLSELIALCDHLGLTVENFFNETIKKDTAEIKVKTELDLKNMVLDTAIRKVASAYNITPELLIWKIGYQPKKEK